MHNVQYTLKLVSIYKHHFVITQYKFVDDIELVFLAYNLLLYTERPISY